MTSIGSCPDPSAEKLFQNLESPEGAAQHSPGQRPGGRGL